MCKDPRMVKVPKRIAWIRCEGSRDKSSGRDYCSSVCCMYATKQAIIAREHDAGVEPTIFFIDMRAHGKGFDRYYRAGQSRPGYDISVPWFPGLRKSPKARIWRFLMWMHTAKFSWKNLTWSYIGEPGCSP